MGFRFPSLYQITKVTLSWIKVALAGIRSHGNDTSSPIAVCTSDNGPVIKNKKYGQIFGYDMIIAVFNCIVKLYDQYNKNTNFTLQ